MDDFVTAVWHLAQSPLFIFLACIAVGLGLGWFLASIWPPRDS